MKINNYSGNHLYLDHRYLAPSSGLQPISWAWLHSPHPGPNCSVVTP